MLEIEYPQYENYNNQNYRLTNFDDDKDLGFSSDSKRMVIILKYERKKDIPIYYYYVYNLGETVIEQKEKVLMSNEKYNQEIWNNNIFWQQWGVKIKEEEINKRNPFGSIHNFDSFLDQTLENFRTRIGIKEPIKYTYGWEKIELQKSSSDKREETISASPDGKKIFVEQWNKDSFKWEIWIKDTETDSLVQKIGTGNIKSIREVQFLHDDRFMVIFFDNDKFQIYATEKIENTPIPREKD